MSEHGISEKVLKRVAKNARIRLSQKELSQFALELKDVLDAFSKIDEVDVENETPSFQPLPIKNVFRQDISGKTLSQSQALSNTKHKKAGYFLGPKVVD